MKSVLVFMAQGVEPMELSAFTDVLGWANDHGDEPISVVTVGLRTDIRSTFGLQLKPDHLLSDVDADSFGALAIPGGFESTGFYEGAFNERFLEVIRNFDTTKRMIAAVCVGALPIGKSGVLTNRKATTYHLDDGKRRNQLADFGVLVQDERLVIDNNIITSTGPESAPDVAFSLLTAMTTSANTTKIKTLMGF